jgi:hypothetical protein
MPIRCSVTMVTRVRLIIAILVAATLAAAVTIASAATATTPQQRGCITPRFVGLTERAAAHEAHTAGCIVHLTGAALKQPTVQTVAAQAPAAGTSSIRVRLTLNPLCFGAALTGPPHNQGMRPGPTELITGLYLVGGPVLPYSSPHCRRPPGKPGTPVPGTIDVLGPIGATTVASQTVKRGRLVTFRLAPGRYRVGDRAENQTPTFARPFTIRAGYTTIRYVIEPVP